MKTKLIAAAIAAIFMLPFFGLAAYAAPVDETPLSGDMTEIITAIEDMTEDDTVLREDSPDYAEEQPEPTTGGLEDFSGLPTPPPGTGTVIDYSADSDGTLFYTIMTPDEHVFYLVIEKNRNIDNVYFLNAVTVADLLPLAEQPPQAQGGATTMPLNTSGDTEQPVETRPPTEQEQAQGGGNTGTLIFVVVIAVLGGGAGWYFKIYRPKQRGVADSEEYDPSMDGADSDYADDWCGDADEADDDSVYGEGAGNGDDSE